MDKVKIIRYLCMGLYFFLGGVEGALILPTLNGYLASMGASQDFLGVVLSAFSVTGLIAAPIFGKIADRTRATKLCVIAGNIFEIIGNFMYFVGLNIYMILGARLVAGIGPGAESAIYGMMSRTTTVEERTRTFSFLLLLKQVGVVVGPTFNIFLDSVDFYIGPFHVNRYTSPGLLMATVWLIHTLLVLILYRDTERNRRVDPTQDNQDETKSTSEETTTDDRLNEPNTRTFVDEFLREEVIICLTATFLVNFAQCVMETALTPMTLLYFGWGGLQNSYLFTGGAACVVISFIAITFLSKRFSDRSLLLGGCFAIVATYILSVTIVTVYAEREYSYAPPWLLPLFIVNTIALTLSLPFLWVPQTSIFSKVTSIETQAFNQGVRIISMGLALIVGPIWGSSMATVDRLPYMVGVNLCLMVMMTGMVIISYKRLKLDNLQNIIEEGSSQNAQAYENLSDDETSPLLQSSETLN